MPDTTLKPFVKSNSRRYWPLLILPPVLGAYVASFAMWRDRMGNVVTALHSGWGDLLFHIRAAIFVIEQGGWPSESFFLAGEPIGYAVAADFIAGWLWHMGFSISTAFAFPTITLVTIFLILLEILIWRLTKSLLATAISTVLMMGFGGLSGFYVIVELVASGGPWLEALRALPHGITAWHDVDMVILNPLIMMLHQRAYLLGFPLFIALLLITWYFLQNRSSLLLIAATLAGILLAFVHPFTWAVWCLIAPSWLLWVLILTRRGYRRRQLLLLLGSYAMVSVIGLLIVKGLQPSAAKAITWHPGWLAPTVSWPLFWLKNIGLHLLLLPFTLGHLLRTNRFTAALLLASLTPFVAANLFQFSPWDWDNTKLFAPTWIIVSMATGILLASLWHRSKIAGKIAVVAGVLALILSGGLEIARVFSYRSAPLAVSTPADEELGQVLRTMVARDAIILTAPVAHHPIFMYSGRPSFVAYEGWLWSQGWQGKYEQRLRDTQNIYRGGPTATEALAHNRIAYVVIGPAELAQGANQSWFNEQYSMVLKMNDYHVYDVRSRQ